MTDRYNLGVDLTDRHVVRGNGDRVALRFEDSAGFREEYTYRGLAALANRFAYVLRGLGVVAGDRVMFRLPNHPAFVYGALGCAKAGVVFIPSSTQFREREVEYRLRDSGAVVVVTTAELAREVDAVAGRCPALREVVIVDDAGEPSAPHGRVGLSERLAGAREHSRAIDTAAEDPAFIAYSSGTTGEPKGIVHAHRYARAYDALIRDWHGYVDGDVCACPAEIGWMLPVASTFLYAMRAGITTLLYRERAPRFRPDIWCELIERHGVTSFVGTPTMYRMLLTVEELARRSTRSIRRATSAGEPLPPDTLARARSILGVPPLDGIGMSECMVYAHNRADEEIVPGSCGRAAEGVELAVLDDELRPVEAGEEGVLCLRRESHEGLMLEYLGQPAATAEVFRGDWYWSGDVVVRDAEGRFFFRGRADDVMKCSGYRISPFEVESALCAHRAVLEAAAVESPDPMKGNVVKGFVTLREGFAPSDELAAEIVLHVKGTIAPFKAPRQLEFVAELPKTQSGKIRRRVLRGA